MRDGQVPTSKIITFVLWAWTGFVLIGAWAAWLAGRHELAAMVGFTACASSAVAATSQIRCYTLRVCGLLRIVGSLDGPHQAELRPLR